MKINIRYLAVLAIILLLTALTMMKNSADAPSGAEQRVADARERAMKKLTPLLEKSGLELGNGVFIRVFKESKELELFLKDSRTGKFKLLKTYKICTFSGKLGPKLKEGDRQAPEGFYFVPRSAMNPQSKYHLSFDLGYPNAFDRAQGRTGDLLMVHGNCVSLGCFAMTDPLIEEIYTLADAALAGGQTFFRVHCLPFRMTAARMEQAEKSGSEWLPFWENLQEGYVWFEREKTPPDVVIAEKRYKFDHPEN